jgi:hypothetical protein
LPIYLLYEMLVAVVASSKLFIHSVRLQSESFFFFIKKCFFTRSTAPVVL